MNDYKESRIKKITAKTEKKEERFTMNKHVFNGLDHWGKAKKSFNVGNG